LGDFKLGEIIAESNHLYNKILTKQVYEEKMMNLGKAFTLLESSLIETCNGIISKNGSNFQQTLLKNISGTSESDEHISKRLYGVISRVAFMANEGIEYGKFMCRLLDINSNIQLPKEAFEMLALVRSNFVTVRTSATEA
jgi:hypothetical protein